MATVNKTTHAGQPAAAAAYENSNITHANQFRTLPSNHNFSLSLCSIVWFRCYCCCWCQLESLLMLMLWSGPFLSGTTTNLACDCSLAWSLRATMEATLFPGKARKSKLLFAWSRENLFFSFSFNQKFQRKTCQACNEKKISRFGLIFSTD